MSEPYATCQYIKWVSLYTFIRTQPHACLSAYHITLCHPQVHHIITNLMLTCQHTMIM